MGLSILFSGCNLFGVGSARARPVLDGEAEKIEDEGFARGYIVGALEVWQAVMQHI